MQRIRTVSPVVGQCQKRHSKCVFKTLSCTQATGLTGETKCYFLFGRSLSNNTLTNSGISGSISLTFCRTIYEKSSGLEDITKRNSISNLKSQSMQYFPKQNFAYLDLPKKLGLAPLLTLNNSSGYSSSLVSSNFKTGFIGSKSATFSELGKNRFSNLQHQRYFSTFGKVHQLSKEQPAILEKGSQRTPKPRTHPSQKIDVQRLMATENEWISAGQHRVHAWSISGMESCVVANIMGTPLAFDIGYATRPSIQCGHVFISHGHIDHVAAIVKHAAHRSLFSLKPATYYAPPHLVEPLRALAASVSQLHGGDEDFCDLNIKPVSPGEMTPVTKGLSVRAFPTLHRVPSQGYIVYHTKKCLKDEYVGIPGPEIGALVKAGTDIHQTITTPQLAYTGDTTFEVFLNPPTEDLLRVNMLITEATYIDDEKDRLGRGGVQRARDRGHTHIQELIDHEQIFTRVEHIILVHFSDKYSVRYIRKRTQELLTEGLKDKVSLGVTLKERLG